jgi:hypothetical protein
VDDGEIVFLATPLPEPRTVTVRSATRPAPVAWDPVTLRRTSLPEVAGAGRYRLDLPATGSVFLVPGGRTDPPQATMREIPLGGGWRLTLPGVGEYDLPDGPRPWTELEGEAVGFAGVGTYVTEVWVEDAAAGGPAHLSLADVGDVARVRVNGRDCGVVWTEPWRVEVTGAVRPGPNTVEIDVANAWMNRLIAEAAAPTGRVFAPAAAVYAPDAPVRPSGLLGAVRLEVAASARTPAAETGP